MRATQRRLTDVALYRLVHEKVAETRLEVRSLLNEKSDSGEPGEENRNKFQEVVRKLEVPAEHALAQYVVHRKVMLSLFEKALQRDSTGHYPLEEAVHQIVFPMRATSNAIDFDRQNLWLLDERLTSHSFLASDKTLKSLDNTKIDSLKRGDPVIFGHPLAYSEVTRTSSPLALAAAAFVMLVPFALLVVMISLGRIWGQMCMWS